MRYLDYLGAFIKGIPNDEFSKVDFCVTSLVDNSC